MAAVMNTARALIRSCLDLPALLDRIGDDEDLVGSGINSGEIVKIALECENRIGRLLTDDELAELSTVRAVDNLLKTGGPAVSGLRSSAGSEERATEQRTREDTALRPAHASGASKSDKVGG
jgi:hypothetical protein